MILAIYISIDLKSFYASVECLERGLDPLTTNLVVADNSRTDKTICLAVTPSLKSFGIPGRPRLFEVIQKVREANVQRKWKGQVSHFQGKSSNMNELNGNPHLEIDYITAIPRMGHYLDYSTRIYDVYLKYISPEDIHVYSIDEVFIDASKYLSLYHMSARDLTRKILKDVVETTGITATAGIGTNLYLAKIAMDIVAKKMPADESGARIAQLNEISYREQLWAHTPITDFWRVGKGYAGKLEQMGMYTMGDVARCSLGKQNEYQNEDLLYKLFGVNAELLIDHAWGYEPCTIEEIKSYKPLTNSITSGQVLHTPYTYENAKLVIHEMLDLMSLDLVAKKLVTNQLTLTINYDIENLTNAKIKYEGAISVDVYGRKAPKHAHGTINLEEYTSSTHKITEAGLTLYNRIVDQRLLVRKINITANKLIDENTILQKETFQQLTLFTDYEEKEKQELEAKEEVRKERAMQDALITIKGKYGKNAVLKGMNLLEHATSKDRNKQIGGHRE